MRRRRWLMPLVAAAATLMFVLLSGMTVWNISLQHQVGSLTTENSALQYRVVAQTYSLQGTAGTSSVTGQLTYYPKQNLTVLVMRGLPQLEGKHVYQGWLIQGKQPTSIGLLNVQNGSAVVGFQGNVKGFDLAAVSLEPGPMASPRVPQGQVLAAGLLQHPTRS
jgi:anti-sigma-K factor RskA